MDNLYIFALFVHRVLEYKKSKIIWSDKIEWKRHPLCVQQYKVNGEHFQMKLEIQSKLQYWKVILQQKIYLLFDSVILNLFVLSL